MESGEQGGATFTVSLPRAGGPTPELPAGSDAAVPRGSGERLLIVEDEAAAREALLQILSALGYGVAAAGSGTEAGALPAEAPFDALLTDVVLPDVSGLDLARELTRRWPKMRVILMSGYSDDAAIRLAVPAGEVRFLQKPFGIDLLARELRAALEE